MQTFRVEFVQAELLILLHAELGVGLFPFGVRVLASGSIGQIDWFSGASGANEGDEFAFCVDSSLDESGFDDIHIFLHDLFESLPLFQHLLIENLLLYLLCLYLYFELQYLFIEFLAELSEEFQLHGKFLPRQDLRALFFLLFDFGEVDFLFLFDSFGDPLHGHVVEF